MRIIVSPTPEELGKKAAELAAACLNRAIKERGRARLVLSTGASQFTTLAALIQMDVDWKKVEMFHLDEYVGLPESHKASFRKYLKERFISQIPLGAAYLVDGTKEGIPALTAHLREAPIDLGLIGIGENAHIAFNDPPADLDTKEAYIVVALNEACKRQQVREGWFPSPEAVPREAISMTVSQILQCRTILSCVPFEVKKEAIRLALTSDASPMVPAACLKAHPDFTLLADTASFSAVDVKDIRPAPGCSFTVEASF